MKFVARRHALEEMLKKFFREKENDVSQKSQIYVKKGRVSEKKLRKVK